MPNALWPFFEQNRHLLNDLPAIGANAIEYWASGGVELFRRNYPGAFELLGCEVDGLRDDL